MFASSIGKHTHIMKKVVYSLFSLFTLTSFAQTDYKVILPEAYANKYTISDLEAVIPTYNRHLNGSVLDFSSPVNYSPEAIDSIFRSFGITPLGIENSKGMSAFMEKAGGTDCESGQQLCNNSSLPGNSAGFGIQELNASNKGCLNLEHQSSWYYLTIATAGNIVMRINPSAADDYDFAFWGPFTAATAGANCPPISTPIRCSWAAGTGNTGLRSGSGDVSESAGGDKWVDPLTVSVGQVYILLVDNFASTSAGYDIDFSWGANNSTAVIGCIPIALPVEISSFQGEKVNSENRISWTTQSETNNDYFIIESTTDPNTDNWKVIGNVNGSGTTVSEMSYNWEDFSFVRNQINYYRITQVDFDGGKRVYSKLLGIDNRIGDKNVVKIVNLLGQEVDSTTPGLVIYCYDDGTTEKIYN